MGYHVLAQRLACTNGTDNFSSPVQMNGNAVQIDSVCFNLGGSTSYTLELQGSNDGANFSVITTNAGLVLGLSTPTKSTGIGFAMVRMRVSVSAGSGTIIIAYGINISHQ
ncbi:MAG: hypothetical protein AAB074_22455 [Planctomycetota bacterium]